jgi:hypothetical protein
MGYYIFSFGVKINRVRSLFGCKDQGILDGVKTTRAYDRYKPEIRVGTSTGRGLGALLSKQLAPPPTPTTTPAPKPPAFNVNNALDDIIWGNPYHQPSGDYYGYAVICLCEFLGTKLPYIQEIKLGYDTGFIDKYMKESFHLENFNLERLLFETIPNPLEIPEIDDWPMIGILPLENIKQIRNQCQQINISDKTLLQLEKSNEPGDEEKLFAYQHIQGIIQNLEFCIAQEMDMVSFCH